MKRIIILTISIIHIISSLKSQNQEYQNLVFEGAGIRGIAHAGALKELQEKGMLDSIRRVGGTSSGAIIGTAYVLGYSPDEIIKLICDTRFSKFNDGRMFFFGGITRVYQKYGWYKGEAFYSWIEDLIELKTHNQDITFKELHDSGYIDLYITGTSLNNQKPLIFSHETYPDMKLKDAVRISMSIPLYFQPVIIDSVGKAIKNPVEGQYYDVAVDGGLLNNYPINLFDYGKYLTGNLQYATSDKLENYQTIGIRIDNEKQIEYDLNNKGLSPYDINDLRSYLSAFYELTLESINRSDLNCEDFERTIFVSYMDIGPKVRNLTDEEKQLLIENGRKGVREFYSRSNINW